MAAGGTKAQKKEHKTVPPFKVRPKKDSKTAKKDRKGIKEAEEDFTH